MLEKISDEIGEIDEMEFFFSCLDWCLDGEGKGGVKSRRELIYSVLFTPRVW